MKGRSALPNDPEDNSTDDNFRIIGQARSSFHLRFMESVYIKTQNQWRSVTFSTGYSVMGCGWVWLNNIVCYLIS